MIILNKSQADTILGLVMAADDDGGASEDAYTLAKVVVEEFPHLKAECQEFLATIDDKIEMCRKHKADNLKRMADQPCQTLEWLKNYPGVIKK